VVGLDDLETGQIQRAKVVLEAGCVGRRPAIAGSDDAPPLDEYIVVVVSVADACAESVDEVDNNLGERCKWYPANRIRHVVTNGIIAPLLWRPQRLPVPVPNGV